MADSQSGELAHVGEGRVGQRVNPVVAQVSERKVHHEKKCGRNLHAPQYLKAGVSGPNVHQLQVFEAGQLLRHHTELVPVQIPEQRHKVGTGKSNRDEICVTHLHAQVQNSRVMKGDHPFLHVPCRDGTTC